MIDTTSENTRGSYIGPLLLPKVALGAVMAAPHTNIRRRYRSGYIPDGNHDPGENLELRCTDQSYS